MNNSSNPIPDADRGDREIPSPASHQAPLATPGTDAAIAARHTGGSRKDAVARYYSLIKPGVLYANVMTAIAGFLFGSKGQVDVPLLIAVTIGTTLVVASATVLNNVLDRDIDNLMERTKTRATVVGSVDPRSALLFSVLLGVVGALILAFFTTLLVLAIGFAGFVVYVWLYGALSKRRSYHGTLVGSVSGAAPILAGYVGAVGGFDTGAVLVFLALFFWQMPEFYSIAVYRRDEYAAAGVPVISVVRGIDSTIRQIFVYTVLYVVSVALLGVLSYTGVISTTVLGILGAGWIILGIRGLKTSEPDRWARQMFRFSLVAILALCLMLSIDSLLP